MDGHSLVWINFINTQKHREIQNTEIKSHLDDLDLVRLCLSVQHFSLFGSAPEIYSSDASYAF